VTRRNDRSLDVANRDLWMVTAVGRGGILAVEPRDRPPGGARVLLADYVTRHVELAYASTVYGAQGDTVTAAHVVVGEHTGAASVYVGMTRGRRSNTAHLVAASVEQARDQWLLVFARDRADLGPGHAATLAVAEAAGFAQTPARSFEAVVTELRAAWADEQRLMDRLEVQQLRRFAVESGAALHAEAAYRLASARAAHEQAAAWVTSARQQLAAGDELIAAETDRIHGTLLGLWDAERQTARQAAQAVLDGPGWFGLHRGAVARAHMQLTDWYHQWAPHVPTLGGDIFQLPEFAAGPDDHLDVEAGLHAAARRAAAQAHPERRGLAAAAGRAERDHDLARAELARVRYDYLNRYGSSTHTDYAEELARIDRSLDVTGRQLTDARARITTLTADPAILAQPAERLPVELQSWRTEGDAARARRRTVTPRLKSDGHDVALPGPDHRYSPGPSHRARSIGI
jgi:hypothetical protein